MLRRPPARQQQSGTQLPPTAVPGTPLTLTQLPATPLTLTQLPATPLTPAPQPPRILAVNRLAPVTLRLPVTTLPQLPRERRARTRARGRSANSAGRSSLPRSSPNCRCRTRQVPAMLSARLAARAVGPPSPQGRRSSRPGGLARSQSCGNRSSRLPAGLKVAAPAPALASRPGAPAPAAKPDHPALAARPDPAAAAAGCGSGTGAARPSPRRVAGG
jgi:hypothetical protein